MKKQAEPTYKVTFLGCVRVGKTAIINRLINKSFTFTYEPTKNIENYACHYNLNEENVGQRTYANVIIEDTFGLNNSILNKPQELLVSKELRQLRQKMTRQFKEIMFTSADKNEKMSGELHKVSKNKKSKPIDWQKEIYMEILGCPSEHIERNGFIFVCDCVNENTMETAFKLIQKLQEVEKSNNLIYPKMLLFNMSDKVNENEFYEFIQKKEDDIETLKKKCELEFFKVSALTGQGINEAFKRFLGRIHQKLSNEKQNEGIQEADDDEDVRIYNADCNDKLNFYLRKLFCGREVDVPSCGLCGKAKEEDEDEDK